MKRIAAPMIGGVVTSAFLGLLLYPILYVLWRGRGMKNDDPIVPITPLNTSETSSKTRKSRKLVLGSIVVGVLIVASVAALLWLSSTGPTSDAASDDKSIVIASQTVNGLDVKVTNPQGELHDDENKVALEFHDGQTGDLVDVGKVSFALNMSMPGMQMRSPATIKSTPTPGRYLADIKPDMVGDWNGVILYDGPRGHGEVHLSFSVKN
jgi:hypothetical protein